jgi:phosphohistidine phosphatase
MKTLLVIRHAKSSWANATLNDFDRPLNDRGKTDAPMMGRRLKKRQVPIDLFISSPAKRAFKTAEYFSEEFDVPVKNIHQEPTLYMASPDAFYRVINATPDKYDHIALFSHNPGITSFVNQLTKVTIDNMPTCGVFAVKIAIARWQDFQDAEKEFWFFDYPKNTEE